MKKVTTIKNLAGFFKTLSFSNQITIYKNEKQVYHQTYTAVNEQHLYDISTLINELEDDSLEIKLEFANKDKHLNVLFENRNLYILDINTNKTLNYII